jgi:hypothetical protein
MRLPILSLGMTSQSTGSMTVSVVPGNCRRTQVVKADEGSTQFVGIPVAETIQRNIHLVVLRRHSEASVDVV